MYVVSRVSNDERSEESRTSDSEVSSVFRCTVLHYSVFALLLFFPSLFPSLCIFSYNLHTYILYSTLQSAGTALMRMKFGIMHVNGTTHAINHLPQGTHDKMSPLLLLLLLLIIKIDHIHVQENYQDHLGNEE